MEMARLSLEDGLVMQIHAGALRDHNRPLFERFGPDMGGDIPVATEFTRNLHPLLNAYGNDPRFTLVAFTLDESTYSRELAPLAGHYPALRLGPPWWLDRKSTRLNSSHQIISYAVFCLKKKKNHKSQDCDMQRRSCAFNSLIVFHR